MNVPKFNGLSIGKRSIKPITLYKQKTTNMRLSPNKADVLLVYSLENKPERLELS